MFGSQADGLGTQSLSVCGAAWEVQGPDLSLPSTQQGPRLALGWQGSACRCFGSVCGGDVEKGWGLLAKLLCLANAPLLLSFLNL